MQALWMLVASVLFACMGVCVKFAALTHSAVEITFYRSFISLLIMTGVVRWRGVAFATAHWRWQLTRGFVGFTALFCYFFAITLLPLATAVTLNYTSAIFLAVYLGFSGTRLAIGIWWALGLGLLGVGILLKPTLGAEQLFGGLLGLISGAVAGMAYFSVRELGSRGEPESRTVFYFALVSSLCAGAWLVFSDWHAVDSQSALWLAGVGVLATLAQLAMTRAYARGKTLVAASLAYSTVIFSSGFGALLWNEVLDGHSLLAVLLIILSGIAATHFSHASPVEQD